MKHGDNIVPLYRITFLLTSGMLESTRSAGHRPLKGSMCWRPRKPWSMLDTSEVLCLNSECVHPYIMCIDHVTPSCSLLDRQESWRHAEEVRIASLPDPSIPPGHALMPKEERLSTLQLLEDSESINYSSVVRSREGSTDNCVLCRNQKCVFHSIMLGCKQTIITLENCFSHF